MKMLEYSGLQGFEPTNAQNRMQPLLMPVNSHDLVAVSVIDSPSPHVLRATVQHIYSCRHGITPDHLGTVLQFYSGPMTWGNLALEVGECGLLFVHKVSGIFNEYPWRGHMVLEEVDGERYARLQYADVWLRPNLPEAVRAASYAHPTRRNHSLVRFDVLEAYLKALIENVDRNEK
ncbi:hypothetical protein [Burkholderia sp. Ac-20349]|uniref:hypothetical protein n=1 Tax=Burkholderia sp. Ac-20349 TaxID=2703893 RepID=UPI00197C4470|nr:hypothetical protein [Burkholderia sp. Ac-20349]MBN3844474.1 hypothetical protein [Burkholderia sp. Ac-20349]